MTAKNASTRARSLRGVGSRTAAEEEAELREHELGLVREEILLLRDEAQAISLHATDLAALVREAEAADALVSDAQRPRVAAMRRYLASGRGVEAFDDVLEQRRLAADFAQQIAVLWRELIGLVDGPQRWSTLRNIRRLMAERGKVTGKWRQVLDELRRRVYLAEIVRKEIDEARLAHRRVVADVDVAHARDTVRVQAAAAKSGASAKNDAPGEPGRSSRAVASSRPVTISEIDRSWSLPVAHTTAIPPLPEIPRGDPSASRLLALLDETSVESDEGEDEDASTSVRFESEMPTATRRAPIELAAVLGSEPARAAQAVPAASPRTSGGTLRIVHNAPQISAAPLVPTQIMMVGDEGPLMVVDGEVELDDATFDGYVEDDLEESDGEADASADFENVDDEVLIQDSERPTHVPLPAVVAELVSVARLASEPPPAQEARRSSAPAKEPRPSSAPARERRLSEPSPSRRPRAPRRKASSLRTNPGPISATMRVEHGALAGSPAADDDAGGRAAPVSKDDRRRSPRYHIAERIEVGCGGSLFYTGVLENISGNGLFVCSFDIDARRGDVYHLGFRMPDGYCVETRAEVAWTREFRDDAPDVAPGVGLRFLDLSAEAEERINAHIAREGSLLYED